MVEKHAQRYITRFLIYSFLIVVLYYPLNGLVGLVVAHYSGIEYVKLLKDLVILGIGVGVLALYLTRYGLKRLTQLLTRPLNLLILAFIMLSMIYAIAHYTDFSTLYGLLINTRYLLVFFVAQMIGEMISPKMRIAFFKVLFWIGAVIAVVAVMEFFIPSFTAWLQSHGYWVTGLQVDANSSFPRSSGTLRGPNELGPYMIIVIMIGLYLLLTNEIRGMKQKALVFAALGVCIGANMLAFSRSGYLGLFVALIIFLTLVTKRQHIDYVTTVVKRHKAVAIGSISAIIIVGILSLIRIGGDTLSIVFLHTDPNEASSVDSDDVRLYGVMQALRKIQEEPLGNGLGSAGLASFHRPGGGIISENYYLQLGVEMGILGMLLFVVISLAIIVSSARHPDRLLRALLISTFIGISIANLFLHVWADEAVAVVWWAIAGLCILNRYDKKSTLQTETRNGRI